MSKMMPLIDIIKEYAQREGAGREWLALPLSVAKPMMEEGEFLEFWSGAERSKCIFGGAFSPIDLNEVGVCDLLEDAKDKLPKSDLAKAEISLLLVRVKDEWRIAVATFGKGDRTLRFPVMLNVRFVRDCADFDLMKEWRLMTVDDNLVVGFIVDKPGNVIDWSNDDQKTAAGRLVFNKIGR